jgi:hypothetical protein
VAPSNKQKLELTWIGKENRPKLEPRILLEDPAQSHHAAQRVTDNDTLRVETPSTYICNIASTSAFSLRW